jgi:4-hydroxythreonine-4-phosphate dehydrogenase
MHPAGPSASDARPLLALTLGDPAGVGPEIVLKACADPALATVCRLRVFAHPGLLARVAERLALPLPADLHPVDAPGFAAAAVVPGRIDAACGALAAAAIEAAIRACRDGACAGLVTAPINKAAIHAAGIPFPGHTEWLAARCAVPDATMMMYHDDLAIALVTCHQSLLSVPASLTPAAIATAARRLHAALARLRPGAPRLAICGFNPHAGEGGLFGHEDEVVAPAVAALRAEGLAVDGPLPPDTAFTPAARRRYAGVVCLYHDQGLIPFKALCFDDGVNVSLGLPIVRTSVDHGTAFDIAWQGVADHRSLIAAISLAARLAVA